MAKRPEPALVAIRELRTRNDVLLDACQEVLMALNDYERGVPWDASIYSKPSRDLIRAAIATAEQPIEVGQK